MKKLLLILFFSSLFAQNYTLKIITTNLKNNKGVVQFNIYNNPKNFPDKKLTLYFKKGINTIKNKTSSFTFNLPKGRYLVSVLHDENKNGKIDKGLMLTKEGIGVSNYKSFSLFNRPNFKKGSFILDKDKTIKIKVNYF